ncbi:MAG: hypothetical protein M3Q29_20175 [Chloroflexota bacterium]|nr:hypothetical protein [Chloroflexota bacterium]
MTLNRILALATGVLVVAVLAWFIWGSVSDGRQLSLEPVTGPTPGEAVVTRQENTAVAGAPTVYGTGVATVTGPELVYNTPVPLNPTPSPAP